MPRLYRIIRWRSLVSLFFLAGCYSQMDLKHHRLPIALIHQPYEYHFSIDPGWADFWDTSFVVRIYEGGLPAGMGITADGELVGSPLEIGDFDFRLMVYDTDRGFVDNESFGDDEWFTLFVTEPGTNNECPSPIDKTLSEIALCLGKIERPKLTTGETFSLDVTYYVNAKRATRWDIKSLSFVVEFDPTQWAPDTDQLNSAVLREAATRSGATVSFDTSAEGTLGVFLVAEDKPFVRAGRLLDLPFVSRSDLEAGTYPITLRLLEIGGDTDKELPAFLEINGSVSITE